MIGAVFGTATTTADGRVVVVVCMLYVILCYDCDGEMFVDVEFYKIMFGLYVRVNSEERVVGWFSAGSVTSEARAFVYEFFVKEVLNGMFVYVMLDVDFIGVGNGGEMFSVSVGDTVLATTDRESGESRSAGVWFSEIECEVDF